MRVKGGSFSRHQHRVFETTTRKEAPAAAVRYRLRLRHSQLKPPSVVKRSLLQKTEMTDATMEQQGVEEAQGAS